MTQKTQDKSEVVPSSKKIKIDSVISKMEKTERSVKIRMDKEELDEDRLCQNLTLSVMTALIELNIPIDITIRENDNSYEVIVEES